MPFCFLISHAKMYLLYKSAIKTFYYRFKSSEWFHSRYVKNVAGRTSEQNSPNCRAKNARRRMVKWRNGNLMPRNVCKLYSALKWTGVQSSHGSFSFKGIHLPGCYCTHFSNLLIDMNFIWLEWGGFSQVPKSVARWLTCLTD